MKILRFFLFFLILPLLLGAKMENVNSNFQKIKIFNVLTNKVEDVNKIYKTDADWKKILTPEQYRVTRLKGTEQPFLTQCPIPPKGESGIYQCVGCKTDLFRYENKFESQTGWPSFWQPVSELNIRIIPDNTLGMKRSEILCARCEAHLGHVFNDGPLPSGKRYCINVVALQLVRVISQEQLLHKEIAVFGAGCFWGAEAVFCRIKGVLNTTVGFMGGSLKNPTYKDVCTDKTGHVEVVRVEYDPQIVSYDDLLNVFWDNHDPTTFNRQGPDFGSQYRSVIFYYTLEQEKTARQSKARLENFKKPIVTQIVAAGEFYPGWLF